MTLLESPGPDRGEDANIRPTAMAADSYQDCPACNSGVCSSGRHRMESQTGWVCPQCNKGIAPWRSSCNCMEEPTSQLLYEPVTNVCVGDEVLSGDTWHRVLGITKWSDKNPRQDWVQLEADPECRREGIWKAEGNVVFRRSSSG